MAVLNHVAVTVRDVAASAPWYQALFGVDPVLDEHTDAGFRHVVWAFEDGTIFGIHQHDRPLEGGSIQRVPGGPRPCRFRLCGPLGAGNLGHAPR